MSHSLAVKCVINTDAVDLQQLNANFKFQAAIQKNCTLQCGSIEMRRQFVTTKCG
jgi:hypothetical protein